MTVTFQEPIPLGPNVLIRWTSDVPDAVFRIAQNGVEVRRTRHNSMVMPLALFEAALIEVSDDPDERMVAASSARGQVQITEVAGASKYRVEQNVGGDWELRSVVRNSGTGTNRYRTRLLADGQDHDFRVTPISPEGNDGTPATATVPMHRHPDPPVIANVTTDFQLGGTLVTLG